MFQDADLTFKSVYCTAKMSFGLASYLIDLLRVLKIL